MNYSWIIHNARAMNMHWIMNHLVRYELNIEYHLVDSFIHCGDLVILQSYNLPLTEKESTPMYCTSGSLTSITERGYCRSKQ